MGAIIISAHVVLLSCQKFLNFNIDTEFTNGCSFGKFRFGMPT